MTVKIRSDSTGLKYRNLGWLWNKTRTRLVQPKFLLGRDEQEARDRLLGLPVTFFRGVWTPTKSGRIGR